MKYANTRQIFLAQIGGITLGLAIASAVFINGAEIQLGAILPSSIPRAAIQQLISGTSSTLLDSLSPQMRVQVKVIVIENMRKMYVQDVSLSLFTHMTLTSLSSSFLC